MALKKEAKITLGENKREERETASEMGAVALIKSQQSGEYFFVEWEGKWSLPVGHKKPSDLTMRDTLLRELLEETGLQSEEILWLESLGTVFVQKDKNSPKKWFEAFYVKIGAEAASKLFYREKEKKLFAWLKRRLQNFDDLAKKVLGKLEEKYPSSKIIVGGDNGGFAENGVSLGGEI